MKSFSHVKATLGTLLFIGFWSLVYVNPVSFLTIFGSFFVLGIVVYAYISFGEM